MLTSITPVSALILDDRIVKFSILPVEGHILFDMCMCEVLVGFLFLFFLKSTIVCSMCPDGQRVLLTHRVVLTSR